MTNRDFPDPETMRAVLDLATQAPSVHNTQPWHWRVGAHSVQLYADPNRQLPKTDPGRRDLLLSCGAALNHCTVALAAVGWLAKVHRLPDPADPDHLAAVELTAQIPGGLDVTLAAAIARRRTDHRAYRRWPVPWGDIALMGARAARAGVMLRQIDLIPGLNDLIAESVAGHAAGDPEPDPAVVLALGTETDDDLARLRAGEAASLVLLSATAMGLATCPVTEPLEFPDTRAALRADVFGTSGYPQMLMRVGAAPLDADPLPAPPRRPLPEVTDWLLNGAFVVGVDPGLGGSTGVANAGFA